MNSPRLRLSLCLAACALLAVNPSAAAAAANEAGTLATIRQRGRVIVGNKQTFPTFNFRDPATGRAEGFFADLARALAGRLLGDESKVEFHPTTDENRFEKLASGEVDVLLDTIPANDEKDRVADRSEETFRSGSAFLVKQGSPIRGLDDLKPGARIAFVKANEDIAVVRARAPQAVYLEFEKSDEALRALLDGRADAFTQVITHLFRAASANPGYRVVGRFTTKPYHIWVRKGDAELRDATNEFLRTFRTSGDYERLYDRWFGRYAGEGAR